MKLFTLVATCAAFLRAQAPQPPAFSTLPDDTVVATSDGKPFTAGELRKMLLYGDPAMNNMARTNPDLFLGSVAVLRYLAAEGEKAHIADESPLKEQLQMVRDRMVENAMLNRMRETYPVNEKMMNEYYAENQSRYAQAWIKVIVLGFCPSVPKAVGTSVEEMKKATAQILAHDNCSSKRSEEEAQEEAANIVGRIRAGEDFVKYVKKYSEDDDSKATDGDFGLVTHDNSFRPEIKNAVFALKDGEISDPIRSGASFYIIKIKERTVQPLSSVIDSVIAEIKQKHFNDMMTEFQKRFKPAIEHPEFFATPSAPKAATPQK
ncbi:MAG: peptidylprolyl isomerase [Bryobacteraceae bacterium]